MGLRPAAQVLGRGIYGALSAVLKGSSEVRVTCRSGGSPDASLAAVPPHSWCPVDICGVNE